MVAGYDVNGVPIYTNVDDYIEPARCSIEFWDLSNLEQRYTYDSFSPPSSGALVVSCRVSPPGIASAGSFDIVIEDSEKSLDFMVTRRANIVIIKAKKYPGQDYVNLLYGQSKKVRALRPGGNQLQYVIAGIGSGGIMDERIVDIEKIANPSASPNSTGPDPFLNDVDMQTNNLFKTLLADPASYVVKDTTIADQLNMSQDIVDILDASPVKQKILAINQKYVTASAALQAMLESVGADGGINSYNEPYLKWPNTQLSGITLKTWDDNIAGMGMDYANKNSYFVDAFTWELTWLKADGFTNRYLSQAQQTAITGGNAGGDSGAFNTNGFVSLNYKDYALQIDPQQTRIQNLAIVVEKKGNGTTDPENITTLHGHIVEDVDNAPIGQQVAVWDIPLSKIPVNVPTPMFLTNIVFTGAKTINSTKKYWITAYNRGNSLDNTINWYTVPAPDDNTTMNIASRVIDAGLPWASNHNLNNGWEVTIASPNTLAFAIFDNLRHDIIAEDIESQQEFGLVEDVLQTPFEQSPIAAQRYLDALLQYAAMPKMTTEPGLVTIPNDLFMPGILINIEDVVSGIAPAQNFQAELGDLEYQFGSDENSLGAQHLKVSPIGYYNWRLESAGF